MTRLPSALALLLTCAATALARGESPSPGLDGPSARGYPSLQEAIRANPGRMVYVPAGDYAISEALLITADGSGLFGPGRIVQSDDDQAILRVEGAAGVRIRDLTLTRAEGHMETTAEGFLAIGGRDLVLEGVRVLDNHSRSPAIQLRDCAGGRVLNCLVRDYQCVAVDDRTANPDLGYAFKCLDGTGISIRDGRGTLVQGNRVVEGRLAAVTPELKKTLDLGRYVKKNAVRGVLAGARDWDAGMTDNWLQGAAIHIADPEGTDFVQVLGNTIENAAQGIDIHADHVIVSQNVINDALIGMKAMHGARHTLILGNQFARNTLWSIALMPGAASHAALPAGDGKPARAANVDGGSIIANNIISDFGAGRTRWVWGDAADGCPLRFDHGQLPDNPPLSDVVIQGNVVYDTHRDGTLVDGKPRVAPPGYKYAVRVEGGPTAPRGLHFTGNIFHPGSQGVSNVELTP